MRTLAILVILTGLASAQTFRGNVSLRGNISTKGVVNNSNGGPLTYTARTDSCVHGYSTNAANVSPFYDPTQETCSPALPATGHAGSALVFQEGVSDPIPFLRLDDPTTPAIANTLFVDPDFNDSVVIVTDQSTTAATTIFNLGSDGGYDAFSKGTADDVLLVVNNGGNVSKLFHIIESKFICCGGNAPLRCSPANPCVLPSDVVPAACVIGSTCTNKQISSTAALVFSRNPSDSPNTLFQLDFPKAYKCSFSSHLSGGLPDGIGDTISCALYVDFSGNGGGSIPCSVLPANYNQTWTGQFKVSNLDAITEASGGGGPYSDLVPAGSTTLTTDVFILPVNNQPTGGNWMFQASAGNTNAGHVEPNWAASCPAQGNTCTDGSVTWTNIGKVNGQGPGFDIVHFDPTRGCSRDNTRLSKRYRGTNEGPSWPSAGTPDAAGQWITADTLTCIRMGGSNCGTGGTVSVTDKFTLHAVGQYLNSPYSDMTPTGAGSLNDNYAGSTGDPTMAAAGNGSCVAGSVLNTSYNDYPNSTWSAGHAAYVNGKYVWSPTDHNYYLKTGAGTGLLLDPATPDTANWTYKSGYCYNLISDWNSATVNPELNVGPNFGGDAHSQTGYVYDYRGSKFWYHHIPQPNCPNTTGECAGLYVGAPWSPFALPLLNTTLPGDRHPSYRNDGTLDLQPVPLMTTDVPSWGAVTLQGVFGGGTGVGSYSAPCYDEECLISTDGNHTLYRMGHQYNTGSNANFSAQSAIGVMSQDGLMMAVTSDMMNTRGDHITGSATCANPLRGQYQPSANGAVTYLDFILPVGNNTGNDIYQAVGCPNNGGTSSCTEAGTLPNWNTVCPSAGDYCTSTKLITGTPSDNNVIWLNKGPNTCRSDILLFDTKSAHAIP